MFCRSEMRAPWGFAVKAHGRAAFHILLEGECWLDVDGVDPPFHLRAGDVVVLPRGPGHALRSSRSHRVEWLDDILERTPPVFGQLAYGGTGVKTNLICGAFTIEDQELLPVLSALPAVAVVRSQDGATRWLHPLLELVSTEAASFEPGRDSVVARLADVLLLQTIRHTMQADGDWPQLFDRQVGATLRLMREAPERRWTVEQLASAVSMSRTSLSDRFRSTTGMPPMQYLTRLRIASAARELRTGRASLAEIAVRVGYGSEYALSKAFRREKGVTPSAYRLSSR